MLSNSLVCISGASAGIGEACARHFARLNARLVLIARRLDRLEALASELNVPTHCVQLDVRDHEAVAAAFASLPDEFRGIDVLVNNAGLSRGLLTIQEGQLQDWEEMIDTNLKGLLYVTKAVLPSMVERGQGMIINISSIAGRQVYPKGNVYCATKHATRALSESMQLDLLGSGIRVTNIDPGMVETEFSEVRYRGDTERAAQTYKGMRPLHADDVADAVVFCATRPPHVSVHDMLIMPADQASTTSVYRRSE